MVHTENPLERLIDLSKCILPALGAAVFLGGCGSVPADTPLQKIPPTGSQDFEVKRVGVIEDDLAYGSRRGIYVITDKKTGKEFIGVSGVGISELGSHKEGKATISDER